jgi:outer membrane lipopolysaccharide assembly protein LptE/RlpB
VRERIGNFSLLSLLLMLAFSVTAAGCGYTIHGRSELPFTEIQIGVIENRTLEPKLEDKLYASLVEELMKNGISVNTSAKTRISGVIRTFQMTSLSEKDDITVEYRIITSADFKITDKDGNVRDIKRVGSPFIVSFTGTEDMGTLLARRDRAEKRAMEDVAMEIVGSLISR